MFHCVVTMIAYYTPLPRKSMPVPPPPSPTPTPLPVHYIIKYVDKYIMVGNGLTTAFLILTILALVGLIIWMIRMFVTGRWISARKFAVYAPNVDTGQGWSREAPEMNNSRPAQWIISPPQPQPPVPSQNLLENKQWLVMAEECAELFHELDGLFPQSDPRQEVAAHAMYRIKTILQRSGAEPITRDRAYDIHRHQLVPPDPTVAPGTPIARIISPGFAVGDRVLLPAKVQVVPTGAKKFERGREGD